MSQSSLCDHTAALTAESCACHPCVSHIDRQLKSFTDLGDRLEIEAHPIPQSKFPNA